MDDKIRSAFDAVHASQELKTATFEALRRAKRKRTAWIWMPVAAALAMLVLVFGLSRAPSAYLSIDVNPSVELELDASDCVMAAKAYNEDGAQVLEPLDLKGLHYSEAVALLLDAMQPYLQEDSLVSFTVAAGDAEREAALLQGAAACTTLKTHCVRVNVEVVDEAHSCGLSFGKYAAYQELAEYDPTVTVEDCRHMTMAEIYQEIGHHTGEHHSEESHEQNTAAATNEPTDAETTCLEDEETHHGADHHER